jgi:predicted ABC-type ATPase
MAKPRIVILAGPNGAGKTTASKHLLRDALGIGEFINADIIAAGLSGFAPESVAFEAGRIVLNRIHSLIDQRVSFAFETTLSSKTLATLLRQAKTAGFEIELIYLALPDATSAVERVAARVKQGGHNIPIDVINRRFHRSLKNLFGLYIPLVNRWKVFDNYFSPPVQIAAGTRTGKLILQEQKWKTLTELAQKA